MKIWLVFLGGGIGSIFRFGFQYYMPNTNSLSVPTLSANILSCVILGYLAGLKMNTQISSECYLLLATGFCGGFSTFSTLLLENWQAIRNGNIGIALLYTSLSLILGLLSLIFGYFLSQKYQH
jgi:CrcB protein